MAIKYRLKFNNFDLKDVIVTLESDKYTGAVTDIIGVGGESYSKNVNWGDHPHETHVGTTNASVKVYTNAIDVDSLQMSSDKDWKMRVTVDGVLNFTGFLIPDGIQNTKKGAGNVVQLNATCGLALLSGLKFVPNDTIGLVTHDGQVSSKYAPIMFFRAILSQLGNSLPIKWSTSIRCDEFPTRDSVAGALEWGTNLNLTTMLEFDNIDSMWMFHELAKSLKLWVCQDGDSWSFINKEDEVRLDGWIPVSRIDDGLDAVTSTTEFHDFKQNLNGSQLFDDAYTYYKPAIGKSRVYYNHVQNENILPNGGFDYVDNNKPVGWSFKNGTPAQLKSYPSITERAGRASSLELLPQPDSSIEDSFSLDYPMNVDANVLFKDMRFGFTVLPMDGFPVDDQGYIDWDLEPLKISVKYQAVRDGLLKDYYLNEFGYWQDAVRGGDLGVFYEGVERTGLGLNTLTFEVYYNGVPNIGDTLVIGIRHQSGSDHTEFSYIVSANEEGNLNAALIRLMDNIPNSINGYNISNKRVTMHSSTRGSIRITTFDGLGYPNGRTYKSGQLQDYKNIYPMLQRAKPMTDVCSWEFQSKGNSGNILMPDPLELYNKDVQAGKLTLEFFVHSGQRYILDDVWMSFNGNQDIYELTTNKDNSFEKFDIGVSSSFSGFMLSSYMNNYGDTNKMMNFTDYSATSKRLTELYGRGIMNWRYTPRMMYQGSFKVNSFSPFALVSVGGKKYIPLTYDYNVNKGQLVGAKLFEARIESPTIDVGHNNFKDKDGANYGNSSGSEGTLDLEQDLQAVTDIGAITNRIITVGGIRTGDLLSVPTHSPNIQLIANGEAYAWVGDGATAGTPSGGGTLSGLSDVDVSGVTNGQTITYDSALHMWKNSDGAGGGRWGEITGNITSQSDLVNYVNGQGFLKAEVDTLQSVASRGNTFNGSLRLTNDNSDFIVGNNGDIGLIKKGGFAGFFGVGRDTPFSVRRSLTTASDIRYSDTFEELLSVSANGALALPKQGTNSIEWAVGYAHSQFVGNPHQTQFSELTNKPTTLAGFGIGDAYTKTECDGIFKPVGWFPSWGEVTGKPLIDVDVTPNSIVQRDGSGYVNAVFFKDDNNYIEYSTPIAIYGGLSDRFMYKFSKQAVNQFLGMPANGDTLQSVVDRGNTATTAQITQSLRIPTARPASPQNGDIWIQ